MTATITTPTTCQLGHSWGVHASDAARTIWICRDCDKHVMTAQRYIGNNAVGAPPPPNCRHANVIIGYWDGRPFCTDCSRKI